MAHGSNMTHHPNMALEQRYVSHRQVREVSHIPLAILRLVAVKLKSFFHRTARANPKRVHNVDVATLVRATRVGQRRSTPDHRLQYNRKDEEQQQMHGQHLMVVHKSSRQRVCCRTFCIDVRTSVHLYTSVGPLKVCLRAEFSMQIR